MFRELKKGLAMLLVATLLCGTNQGISVKAAQDNSLSWRVNDITLGHKNVSFTISDVEQAQTATVVLVDRESSEVVLEKDFSIASSSQKVTVDVTDGYIESGSYYVYVKNAAGEKTDSNLAYMTDHSNWFWLSGTAYPNCFEGNLSLSGLKDTPIKIVANIAFKDYEGNVDEEGNVKLEYPHQEVGTIIKFKISDDYGCEYTCEKSVNDAEFSNISFEAWHTGISLQWYDKLAKTERIGAEVDGQTYYSEYGAASSTSEKIMILNYPSTSASSITYWFESTYGSKSEKKTLEIKDCKLDDCSYTVNAYQFKAIGTVKANSLGQKPSKVKVTIEGKEYSADIAEDGSFAISYPSQKNFKDLNFVFVDEHGCKEETEKSVYNTIEESGPGISTECILPTYATLDEAMEGIRLVAQIGNDTYYGEYGGKTVKYPYQAAGTAIKFWLEANNSCLSKVQNAKIYSGEYEIKIEARTESATGDIYSEEYSSDFNGEIKSAYAEIAGKKYNCKIEKKKGDEDDWSGQDTYYHFSVNYPIQKVGTAITFYFTDINQIVVSKKVTLANIAPKIKLDKVDSGSTKITGTTTAKSNVIIKVGKKTTKCKANANGKFSIKIKEQKTGTKVAVSVVTPEGYTNSCSTKVKQATGTLFITNYVYKSSSSVKIKLTNAKKGDKVKVVAGSKTYTKKITSNKKTQKVTIKIKKQPAGKTVKATLYDKFSKKKDSETTMVYYGDSIYVGMSSSNALLTTWGRPVRRNDYGFGSVQWVYESGRTTMYVYVRGGKVVNIQKINY